MTSLVADGVVEFRFFRPGAREVRVVGDFNHWRQDALLMRNCGDGWWAAEAGIDSGEYRFRYVADGVWYTDFASNGVEKTKVGYDSLLIIPAKVAGKPQYQRARQVA